jgi:16S rRNA (adenine1518-N6/adenine1519-N6)-dimethyltransferase
MADIFTKKSLGQHWLRDEASLGSIVAAGDVNKDDTVLEIGPGLGTLTKHLVKAAHKVVAVEFDEVLAGRLTSEVGANNLIVKHQDILSFDLGELPPNYKVVANIPYYLTGKILRLLTDANNSPEAISLLVQKEVAQRIGAKAGDMSIIAVAAQLNYEVKLGGVIEAKLFTPPPKVDSQIISLKRRSKLLFKDLDKKAYMHVVRAGFSSPRKKLRSSLSAGLAIDKSQADELLKAAKVSGELRPQNLSLKDWHRLHQSLHKLDT